MNRVMKQRGAALISALAIVTVLVVITTAATTRQQLEIRRTANMLKYDQMRVLAESLDAWAIHGVGGFWGALATGIFCAAAIGGVDGLIYGNAIQFAIQFADAIVAMLYAFVVTYIIALVIDRMMGLRVNEDEEYVVEINSNSTIIDILNNIGVNAETVVVSKNDVFVPETETVTTSDKIDVFRVISGG